MLVGARSFRFISSDSWQLYRTKLGGELLIKRNYVNRCVIKQQKMFTISERKYAKKSFSDQFYEEDQGTQSEVDINDPLVDKEVVKKLNEKGKRKLKKKEEELEREVNFYHDREIVESSESDFEEVKDPYEGVKLRPDKFPPGSKTAEYWKIVDMNKEIGKETKIELYNKILESYIEKSWNKRSILLFEHIIDNNIIPDIHTFNLMGKLYDSEFESISGVYNVYGIALLYEIKFDQTAFEILLDCACKSERNDEFITFLVDEILKNEEIKFSRNNYNSVINHYILHNDFDKIYAFIHKMNNEYQMKPFMENCRAILQLYADVGDIDGIENLVELMNHFSIKPDIVLFEMLMDAYLVNENFEEVDRVYKEMFHQFQYHSTMAEIILMRRYFDDNKPHDAIDQYILIHKQRDLDHDVFYYLLKGLFQTGHYDDIKKYLLFYG